MVFQLSLATYMWNLQIFCGWCFFLLFLWIDSTLTFDLLPWSDETLPGRLNFCGGLILQILGRSSEKKRFCTSGGHKFSLLFMDIRYYSANKNLQPTFFMIFLSQLNGRLVRRGYSGFASDREDRIIPGDSNTPPPPPPPKKKKSLDQNLTLKMSHAEFSSH